MNNLISRHRNLLKVIAIIWIMLYHMNLKTALPVLGFLQEVGYGGVDIFFFLAGFGSYYSLDKDDDCLRFMGRKLQSLLPYYIPFILIWMVYKKVVHQIFVTEIVGNVTMTGYLAGAANQFNWYIDGIIVMYLLAPYIYKLIKRTKNVRLTGALLVGAALLVSVAFWHTQLLIIATRLPIFVVGMLVARGWGDKSTTVPMFISALVTTLLGFAAMYAALNYIDLDRWHYGTWWYPFLVITPGLCVAISWIADRLKGGNSGTTAMGRAFDRFSTMTFSLFMWHIFVFEELQARGEERPVVWILAFVFVIIWSILYHSAVSAIWKKIVKK